MSQKISAPTIKLTGIKDGENDFCIPLGESGAVNANGRHYDPAALWEAINNNRLSRRMLSTDIEHPIPRKDLFSQYLGLVPDDDYYRGTPAMRHPFIRKLSLMFRLASLHADLDRTTVMNARQVGKSLWEYRLFNERLHTFVQLQHEMKRLEQQQPKPVDLTRYLKLLTGKDVWNTLPKWLEDVPESWLQPEDIMRAGIGKTLFYNMLPTMKLHLKQVSGVFRGIPYFFNDEFKRGPAGDWPAVIEYGMASNGPAITAQLNRERLTKPKKGKA